MSPVGFLYCTRECPCFGGKKREEGWWPDLRESLLLWKRKPKYLLFSQESSFNPVIGTFAGGQVFLSVSLTWVCICMHKPALSWLHFASLALTTRGRRGCSALALQAEGNEDKAQRGTVLRACLHICCEALCVFAKCFRSCGWELVSVGGTAGRPSVTYKWHCQIVTAGIEKQKSLGSADKPCPKLKQF